MDAFEVAENPSTVNVMSFPIAGSAVAIGFNLTDAAACGGATPPSTIQLDPRDVTRLLGGEIATWNDAELVSGRPEGSTLANCDGEHQRARRFRRRPRNRGGAVGLVSFALVRPGLSAGAGLGAVSRLNDNQRRTLYSCLQFVLSPTTQAQLANNAYAPVPAQILPTIRASFTNNF